MIGLVAVVQQAVVASCLALDSFNGREIIARGWVEVTDFEGLAGHAGHGRGILDELPKNSRSALSRLV